MPGLNLEPDAITFSSVISALAKGKQWQAALEVLPYFIPSQHKEDCFTGADSP